MTTQPGAESLPVIALRPEPGLFATVACGRELGLDVRGFALFAGEAVAWVTPDPSGYAGLLAGSAALFRFGGAQLQACRSLPVHAVGASTARAAQSMGFTVAAIGQGGLDVLVRHLPPGRYLRLAGENHVALVPPPGVTIDTRVVYRMAALPMPAELCTLLGGPALVLLHSAEAARHFAAECARNAIARGHLGLATLAPRIANAAGPGWAQVRTAPEPNDRALLALARQMCESGSVSLREALNSRSCQTTT